MKGKNVVHSSGKDDWRTPLWVYNHFDKDFKFGLDAAADADNSLCEYYLDDALDVSWAGYGSVWLNPPYSKNAAFIKKAYEESSKGVDVVALIPSRTDTKWWHEYVMNSKYVFLIKGRLHFSDHKDAAPFPSCVVVFGKKYSRSLPIFHPLSRPIKSVVKNK